MVHGAPLHDLPHMPERVGGNESTRNASQVQLPFPPPPAPASSLVPTTSTEPVPLLAPLLAEPREGAREGAVLPVLPVFPVFPVFRVMRALYILYASTIQKSNSSNEFPRAGMDMPTVQPTWRLPSL